MSVRRTAFATPINNLLSKWPNLTAIERKIALTALSRTQKEDLFLRLDTPGQSEILKGVDREEERTWLRILPPDDAADLIQVLPKTRKERALSLLDEQTRWEITALMKYAEDRAGGLMNSRFPRLRPDMMVEEAISYLRAQARSTVETIYYAYVLDPGQHLLGTVSFRELLMAAQEKKVSEIMHTDVLVISEEMDQEKIASLFSQNDLLAIPVVDAEKRMKGIVTVDDIVQVQREIATESIQKIGGMEALGQPYFTMSFFAMLKKRAGWLALLFCGEMFTATAMGYFQIEIERAVVLALFIPLIISSGGNSGSQATTLIIRSMALGEVKLSDWGKVLMKELASGALLGVVLGSIGLIRILLWPTRASLYGEHYMLIAITVSTSLIGIVLWGTTIGSMLPFVLRKVGFDPASASAPLVATLVDVTGLVIYFTVASIVLKGTLL